MSIVLGIDCSTQSLTSTTIDLTSKVSYNHSVSYVADPRLQGFGIVPSTVLVPPRVYGEADQPPLLFLKALDCLFEDLEGDARVDLSELLCINISAQQHGQVYLSTTDTFGMLQRTSEKGLCELFADSFSYQLAPTWMTSNTSSQYEEFIASYPGNIRDTIGSDLALRFSGLVIKRIFQTFPKVYECTQRIHLISSFLSSILSGRDGPIDIGNGAGTGLMHFKKRIWDMNLLDACIDRTTLGQKLPPLAPPHEPLGPLAPYFTEKYGVNPRCTVLVGSGDNCQTKSCIDGTLLSLGSSFVVMSDLPITSNLLDTEGLMTMYDGLGKSYSMVCKTNGALVWDMVRGEHSYEEAETELQRKRFSSPEPIICHPVRETFPKGDHVHTSVPEDFSLYANVVESSIAELAKHWNIVYPQPEALYVTGGPSHSHEILFRISALWNCPVFPVSNAGASYGAAYVAAGTVDTTSTSHIPQQNLQRIEASTELRTSAQHFLKKL